MRTTSMLTQGLRREIKQETQVAATMTTMNIMEYTITRAIAVVTTVLIDTQSTLIMKNTIIH